MPLTPVPDMEEAPESGFTHDTPPVPPPSSRALDQLLLLLQGVTANSLADPGIAALPPTQLDLLTVTARRQAEQCQDGIVLMLDLMQDMLDTGTVPDTAIMQRLVKQLHELLHDQQRWHSLADNAAYYRDHTTVAERIAACLQARRA